MPSSPARRDRPRGGGHTADRPAALARSSITPAPRDGRRRGGVLIGRSGRRRAGVGRVTHPGSRAPAVVVDRLQAVQMVRHQPKERRRLRPSGFVDAKRRRRRAGLTMLAADWRFQTRASCWSARCRSWRSATSLQCARRGREFGAACSVRRCGQRSVVPGQVQAPYGAVRRGSEHSSAIGHGAPRLSYFGRSCRASREARSFRSDRITCRTNARAPSSR